MSSPGDNAGGSWRTIFNDVAGRLQQPAAALQELLQDLVGRAVAAVGAAEGSILVPDAEGRHLRFFVSHSPNADRLARLQVPLQGSIVGYVFSTGHMMALGDLHEEKSADFYAEIDKQVGVATRTYLVLPLAIHGHARGVATYVNRPGQPPFRPFQHAEMERARTFAAVEAVVLWHWHCAQQLARLAGQDVARVLQRFDPAAADDYQAVPAGTEIAGDPWTQMLRLLHHFSEHDQTFCAELLSLVARWRDQEWQA